MPRAGLNSLPRPARSALNQEIRQGSCEWLCHSWDAGSELSLVARSKKKTPSVRMVFSFWSGRFCCAKSVACGRVIAREWGNPSKVPPSHSPFLAVGGSADNKTCGQSQKETPSVRMVFFQRVDKSHPCHSEPVTDVTGVGIRNLLAGNLRKSAGIVRFGNGLPRQCVPQGHLLRGAHWLAMTGFFDRHRLRLSPEPVLFVRRK